MRRSDSRIALAAAAALAVAFGLAAVSGRADGPPAAAAAEEWPPPVPRALPAPEPAEELPPAEPAEEVAPAEPGTEHEIEWRRSKALGLPHRGRLVDGVELPREGRTFFTWDPFRKVSPNPRWRRYGTDRLVRTVLTVLEEYAAANPEAPRVGVGDLSRPHGGPFYPTHASHQNGLDVDIYFPRRDRRERPADRPAQVDFVLAQDLVDRFVAAGAERIFVGPRTGLKGPPGVVQVLRNHDRHLHVRLPNE